MDNRINPYSVLGVSSSDSMEVIDEAYRGLLLLLHPDRVSNINLSVHEKKIKLKEVREAYKVILELKKEYDYPDYKLDYTIGSDIAQVSNPVLAKDKFSNEKFNEFFNKDLEINKKMGFDDPFNRGYNDFDNEKDYNSSEKVKMPSRMDLPVIAVKQKSRKVKDNRLVEYAPEISTSDSINYQELGLSNISNFSTIISGKEKLAGTDLMSVYGNNYEYWETSVQRNPELYNKFTDNKDLNRRIQDVKDTRKHIYSEPKDKKIEKQIIKQTLQEQQQEYLRSTKQKEIDNFYNMKSINSGQNFVNNR
jgi:curved DNA-binding protein CbpA